jgi:thioredoxin-related protein
MATPTFVLVDRSGREIERLRGLPGDRDEFMLVVERMLDRVPQSAKN